MRVLVRLPATLVAALVMFRAAPAPAAPPDTLRFSVVIGGRVAGYRAGWRLPDGELRFRFAYNDRGRGDSLETRMRLDPEKNARASSSSHTEIGSKPRPEIA